MCYRGWEIENNILNGPSAPVLFLGSIEQGRGESSGGGGRAVGVGGGGTGVTLKFHTRDMLPSGL